YMSRVRAGRGVRERLTVPFTVAPDERSAARRFRAIRKIGAAMHGAPSTKIREALRQLATIDDAGFAALAKGILGTIKREDQQAAPVETFEVAARRIVAEQAKAGMATSADRLSRLERFAFPLIGPTRVTEVDDIQGCLEAAHRAGRSKETIKHLKIDICSV